MRTPSLRWAQKRSFAIIVSFAFILSVGAVLLLLSQKKTSVIYGAMDVAGKTREYRLVLPPDLAITPKLDTDSVTGEMNLNIARKPIIVALHGALDTTDQMATYTELDRLVEEQDVILVYLQGQLLNWVPYLTEGNSDRVKNDLQFFDQVCELLAEQYQGDLRRVYVVGVSQGGCMCNLMVARRSERIAAAVSSCGWMPKPLDSQLLDTKRKTPMLFLVGEHDRQVPPSTVRQAQQVFDEANHPTQFRLIPNQGHGWPKDWQETEKAWRFLIEHELPG